MKKLHHILAAFALAIITSTAFSAAAQSIQSGDFSYTVNADNTLTLKKYSGNADSITIPESVGEYKVTVIGDSAFYGNITLKHIDIAKSISQIGAYAFYGSSLNDVVIPTSVETIGELAFAFGKLKRVKIADGNTAIDLKNSSTIDISGYLESASSKSAQVGPFYGNALSHFYVGRNTKSISDLSINYDMSTLVLGDSVTTFYCNIDPTSNINTVKGVFICFNPEVQILDKSGLRNNLKDVFKNVYLSFEQDNGAIISKEGITYLIDNNNKTCQIIDCDGFEIGNTSLDIPKVITVEGSTYSVTEIMPYAFSRCYGLKEIKITEPPLSSAGVTGIKQNTFADCVDLEQVILPSVITNIGDQAFMGCCNLTTITYEEKNVGGIRFIGNEAFSGCKKLTGIENNVYIISIGDKAFYECTNLTSINPNESVSSLSHIGEKAFYNCSKLEYINFSQISFIGSYAFQGSGLKNIVLQSANLTSLEPCVFYGMPELETVSLQKTSIKIIPDSAFMYCTKLKDLKITDKVTQIKNHAFAHTGILAFETPLQLVSLDREAFYDSQLDSLIFNCQLTTVDIDAPKLTYVYLGRKVDNIGSSFYQCNLLKKLVVSSLTPPTMTYVGETPQGFSDRTYSDATLYVPDQSVSLYRNDSGWKKFYYIKPSGVNDVVRDADSWSGDDSYYDLQGRKVANPQKGIYIHHGQKVIVK